MTFKKSGKYKCNCKICSSNVNRFLDEICLLCGYDYGKHEANEDSCPTIINGIRKGFYRSDE